MIAWTHLTEGVIMCTADPFSDHYRKLLDQTYDVVDRIVLNAYFPLGGSAGGFRHWWQSLHGTTDNLDDTHLMRMAGRFSRRVRGWAKAHGVPVIYCKSGERKHRIAAQHLPDDPNFEGIFAVMVNKSPAPVWRVLRFDSGGFHLKRREPMPFVNHYSFHIMDRQWGHVTIKVCGHPPFKAMVMLNGHEYVAAQARDSGLRFTKEGNCFTEVSDLAHLARLADTLRSNTAIGRLRRVCERWIYRCVCFALSFDEQKRSRFRYSYSVYQVEYSRNLVFHRGHHMEQVFQGVIDRSRARLNLKRVQTIFGRRQRPRAQRRGELRYQSVTETPEYDLTIFKLHFGRLTVKAYTKGERVLRTEAIAHSVGDLRQGRVIEKFAPIVTELSAILDRFLRALQGVNVAWISEPVLEALPRSTVVGKTRVGGVDINRSRMRAAIEAVIALAPAPRGFTASELADEVRHALGPKASYTARQAAYDLKKLRGKGLIEKVENTAHRYQPTRDGLRSMAALIVLRDKVLNPLLTYNGRCRPGSKFDDPDQAELDARYQDVQRQMQQLFTTLCIAA
jgi:hypothetical protein